MRKFLGVLGIALVMSVAAAPAALAQDRPAARDPFAPLIAPPTADGSIDPVNPTDPTVPVVPVEPVDPLPDTGSSTSAWFAVAYFLMALGGGAVVLSRVFGPPPLSTR